jgi:hypothetical protein
MVMGFLNCNKKRMTNEVRDCALKVLAPNFFSLAFASLPESPFSEPATDLKHLLF